MTDVQVHLCKEPGCTNVVTATRGLGVWCPEHRPTQRPRRAPGEASEDGLVAQLDALRALARKADRLEAQSVRLRREADRAAMAAGEARDELAERMRGLSEP